MTRLEEKLARLNSHRDNYASEDTPRPGQQDYPDDLRTWFEFDQSQIIYSNAIRRLSQKTQMIVEAQGDHFRSRLLHTLEVKEIASQLGDLLGLNTGLISSIALGHDLGHAPYGHAGEEALREAVIREANELSPGSLEVSSKEPFHHASNSMRILAFGLGNPRADGVPEVVQVSPSTFRGALNHSWSPWKTALWAQIDAEGGTPAEEPETLVFGIPNTYEAQVVAIADQLAAINHDTEDMLSSSDSHDYDYDGLERRFNGYIEAQPLSVETRAALRSLFMETVSADSLRNYGRKRRIEFAIRELYQAAKEHPGDLKNGSPESAGSSEYCLPSPGLFGVFLNCFEQVIRGILRNEPRLFRSNHTAAKHRVDLVFNDIWGRAKYDFKENPTTVNSTTAEITTESAAYRHFIEFWRDDYLRMSGRLDLSEEIEICKLNEPLTTWAYYLYQQLGLNDYTSELYQQYRLLVAVTDFVAGLTDRYCKGLAERVR